MVRIKMTSFTTLKPADLVVKAQANVDAVTTAGTVFADIEPSITVVQDAVSDLSAKIAQATTGGTKTKNDRDSAVTTLISCLVQWCGFVLTLANSKATPQQQIEVVESAAFEPIKRGSSIGPLSAVANPRAKGLSQEIIVEWSAKKGAQSYKVMKTEGYPSEQSTWVEHTVTTRCKVSLDCEPGQLLSFAIYPIGTAGIGAQSNYVSAIAGL